METEEIRKSILSEIEKVKSRIIEYKDLTKPVEPDVAIGRISRMGWARGLTPLLWSRPLPSGESAGFSR